jgi:conjugative relaxase-like TrwC/TraI family protein
VLTVAKVTASAATGYANYLEGRSQASEAGDYYLSEGGERVEAPGRWVLGGRGVEALGVDPSRVVEAGAFRAVMGVRHPVSGEMLRRVGGNGEAVSAIDATFSAPKSVSVVWALASPELRAQLEAAQEAAVDRALAYATEQVPMTRRRVDKTTVVRERAVEVLASSWRHTTARAVAGRAPDPQLHSHVLIHGAVRGDGQVVAVESRAWLVHQREVDAAYLSELARGVERLGFAVVRETGRRERYFELAGVPEGLRERFSGRHAQVQAAIAERLAEKTATLQDTVAEGGSVDAAVAAEQLQALGRSGRLLPGEERAVAMRSRAAKSELLTAGDLDRSWWQDAQPYGFDARTVDQLRRGVVVAPLAADALDRRVLERLTEFQATFTDRDVRAAILTAGLGLDISEALTAVDRLTAQGELLELADGRLTTRAHRQIEARTAARAQAVAGGQVRPVDAELAEQEITVLDAQLRQSGAGDGLAGEQAAAIRVACGEGQLVVIEGQAGTGKSTALGAVARAHQTAGRRVVVTSTAALAAERLAEELRETGVDADGFSTMALQARVSTGALQLGAATTVIHDEAALASTREHDWLLGAAEASGARLILVGDPRQSQAVGAGGLWPRIEAAARDHHAHVVLSRIVRAQDPADRRDQSLWRSGQHDRSLTGYGQRGRLVLSDVQARAEDRALEAAHADRQAGRSTLVVAQTSNEHLDALNARAQAIRAQHGELGGQEVALLGRPYGLRAGDEIQIRRPVTHPQLGRVTNGTTARVVDVDDMVVGGAATLALADDRHGLFDKALLDAGQVRLAYVQHPFPAQGQTVDTCHVICSEHATAEGSYVALTRARATTRIYAGWDRLDELSPDSDRETVVAAVAGRLGRTEPELPSIAFPLAHEQRVAAEHARETQPTQPTRPPRPPRPVDGEDDHQPPRRQRDNELSELRAERDRLKAVVDSYPAETAREIRRLEGRAKVQRQEADGDAGRSEHWQDVYQDLGVLARRRVEGRQARERADGFAARAGEQYQHAEQLEHQARMLAEGPDGPGAWERAHPNAREQLYQAETALAAAVDQHARERQPTTTGSDRGDYQQAEWLRAERDQLREQLRDYPRRQADEAEQAERRAEQADINAQALIRRADQAAAEFEQLGRLARRGQRGTQARERQHALEQQAEQQDQRAQADRAAAQRTREQPGGPAEWDRQHPGVRERLAVYEHACQVADEQQVRRIIQHHPMDGVWVLGPRPEEEDERKIWDRGAQAIRGYRSTYAITDRRTVLGAEPDPSSPDGVQQHRDWQHATRQVLEARHQLGVDRDQTRRPAGPSARRWPERPPQPDRGPDRGLGFEL